MKNTLALLIAATALTAATGVSALTIAQSAVHTPSDTFDQTITAVFEDAQAALPFIFVSDDDDDKREYRRGSRHDEDDDDDDDCDDDDDDDDDCNGNPRNAAPAGTVAPPQNGLFGTGAPPQVQVN